MELTHTVISASDLSKDSLRTGLQSLSELLSLCFESFNKFLEHKASEIALKVFLVFLHLLAGKTVIHTYFACM